MDCLLCYKTFIREMEFVNYNPNPQLCKNVILELFGISRNPEIQCLSEDLVICVDCHLNLKDVGDLVEQYKELQRRVEVVKIAIVQKLANSREINQIMVENNAAIQMSQSSLDRLTLLRAIEATHIRPAAFEHDGIDFGHPNESIENQQRQVMNVPEANYSANEQGQVLPIQAPMLKEVKICLERVQLSSGVPTIRQEVNPNHIPTSSNQGHAPRRSKAAATVVEESSNEETSSDSESGGDSTSEDDTEGGDEAINSEESRVVNQRRVTRPRQAKRSVIDEFTQLENGSFQCNQCPNVLKLITSLSRHFAIHGPRRFKCFQCGERFTQKPTLESHVKNIHEGRRSFKCPWQGCGKWFGEKSNLTSHVKVVHEGRKDFKCGVEGCSNAYGRKVDLQKHVSAKHKTMRMAKKRREEVARVNRPRVKRELFDCRMTACRRVFKSESAREAHEDTHAVN